MGRLKIVAALVIAMAASFVPGIPSVTQARMAERILRVKFRVHMHKCTSCGQRLAQALFKVDGVMDSRAVPKEDAALVYFESGRTDLEELKAVVRKAGFDARIVAGPSPVALDGTPEPIAQHEIPRKRPTLEEMKARVARGEALAEAPAADTELGVAVPSEKPAGRSAEWRAVRLGPGSTERPEAPTKPSLRKDEARSVEEISVPDPELSSELRGPSVKPAGKPEVLDLPERLAE